MLVAFLIFEGICLAALLILILSERRFWRQPPEMRQLPAAPRMEATEAVGGDQEERQQAA